MSKTKVLSVVLSCLATVAVADNAVTTLIMKDGTVKKVPTTEFQQKILRRTGGKVKVPNVQKGKVVIVNAKSGAPAGSLEEVASQFVRQLCIDVEVQDGAFDFKSPKPVGEATLFVVDDSSLPMSLVAIEARWGVVNVAPLKCEKPQFFNARIRKESVRVLTALLGGCNSSYPDALTGPVFKAEDLDKFVDTRLQVDIERRFEPYMKGLGIVPYRLTTYRKACEEGWAAQPTNDFQKAIWDEVRAIPTKPMKIEFDPKKGR